MKRVDETALAAFKVDRSAGGACVNVMINRNIE